MTEYRILRTAVSNAEDEINRLAADGWRVIATSAISGMRLTIGSTPLIVTLERRS